MIEALSRPPSPADLHELAQLLADAVDSGASVSFMHPFSVDDARAWWRVTLERADPRAIVLEARAAGFTLLTLDTVRGDPAEQLYATAGWQRVGVIPDDALYPDGTPCDTVVFYKKI